MIFLDHVASPQPCASTIPVNTPHLLQHKPQDLKALSLVDGSPSSTKFTFKRALERRDFVYQGLDEGYYWPMLCPDCSYTTLADCLRYNVTKHALFLPLLKASITSWSPWISLLTVLLFAQYRPRLKDVACTSLYQAKFVNTIVKALKKLFKFEHHFISVYHPKLMELWKAMSSLLRI
ncbi:hypothetical protein QOT17_019286 [Balamuthia mandrillaris]